MDNWFLLTFKMSQDPLENFFGSIRMSCGFGNNPTSIQFKAAFQNLLSNTVNKRDNGNLFVDNDLVYIAGYIMRLIMKKEPCCFCYTLLKENKERLSCQLIEQKQMGGLICPIVDFVDMVKISNRKNLNYFLLV